MELSSVYSEVIELNVEERVGWEAAALEIIRRMEREGEIDSETERLLAAKELAREAQREHRKSFEVTPESVSVPDVEALLSPTMERLAQMASPLARMVSGRPFLEHDAGSITTWLGSRDAFRKSVDEKNTAERDLVDRYVALLEQEGVEVGTELSASARIELLPLAQRALVD